MGLAMERKRLQRSRWAAIGAAVAVTLGGGGLIGVQAASQSSGTESAMLFTVSPTRVLDTRSGEKVSGETYVLQVTGNITTYSSSGTATAEVVPSSATAVGLNLTVTEGIRNAGYGFVTAFPCTSAADAVPSTSSINFVEGVDVANSTTVPIGSTGKICLNVYGSAHLVVDISSYYKKFDAMANDANINLVENRFIPYSNSANCFVATDLGATGDDDTSYVAGSANALNTIIGAGVTAASGSCVARMYPSGVTNTGIDDNRRLTGGFICYDTLLGTPAIEMKLSVKTGLFGGYVNVPVTQSYTGTRTGNACIAFTVNWTDTTQLGLGYIISLDATGSGPITFGYQSAMLTYSAF